MHTLFVKLCVGRCYDRQEPQGCADGDNFGYLLGFNVGIEVMNKSKLKSIVHVSLYKCWIKTIAYSLVGWTVLT